MQTENRKLAAVLAIGDELVLGQTVDTNSAWVSEQLARIGVPVLYHQTVADEMTAIVDAFIHASQRVDFLIISGGIGPTEDDLTRQALAHAMGVGLKTDERALENLKKWFEGRGKPMAERNRVQVLCPEGATMIDNSCGTAPGIRAHLNQANIWVTPGVPREMKAMFNDSILPELKEHAGQTGVILTTKLNTFGAGESNVAEMLGDLMTRDANPKVGTTVANGIVSIRVRSEFDTPNEAEQALLAKLEELKAVLGPLVFGRDEETIELDVFRLLQEKQMTLATAESCTGGLIGKMITDLPGSSAVYAGGWVTYTNEMKQAELGVPEKTITEHGAVSGETVEAMAQGALTESDASVSLAISGIAGPGGGTEAKPVGTIWIALGYRNDAGELATKALCVNLPGNRQSIRDRAAKCALQLLRLHLMQESLDHLQWAIETRL